MNKTLALLIVFSFKAFSNDLPNCSETDVLGGKLFEFEITTSFHGSYFFKFCSGEESYLLSEYIEPVSTNGPLKTTIKHESTAKLDSGTVIYLKDLYRIVQATLREDNTRGLDGSTWCFKPKNGAGYSKACLWEPRASTQERNLENFVNLGNKLYEISNFKSLGK
ncbi:hypothetical protein GSF04_22345 [Pseudoalteromonas sp. A22]|uniref:hypothetical protein n=1 Tax=Pseudoalteromonas sp. A22 TaxID=327511 RepID=UPI001BA7B2FC|nr:hypothetical protein [Pseudoalteromonas sp. A22]QUI65064.1 hypothetical protein GSF04_22345 [Pseudoalteromonas sp. A22]